MKLKQKIVLGVLLIVALAVVVVPFYRFLARLTTAEHGGVELRKFPYPYKAMLAISSDIDGSTLEEFEEIHRYLNTKSMTSMGEGLGLDVADSFWMYVATDKPGYIDQKGHTFADQMSYFYGTDWRKKKDAAAIIKYYRAGWIDSIHTYGDFIRMDNSPGPFSRTMAQEALKELKANGIKVEVWIDHGNQSNIQNFVLSNRPTMKYMQGDNPECRQYYHTDLLADYGIRFGWGPCMNTIGRDTMLYPRKLRDGRKIWAFYRYTDAGTDAKGKTRWLWNPMYLAEQLKPEKLAELKAKGQYAIVAQHLGANIDWPIFWESARAALRNLADEYYRGEILVTRTSRLLKYNLAQQYVKYQVVQTEQGKEIHIEKIDDPLFGPFVPSLDEVRGLTFYVDDDLARVSVWLGNERIGPDDLQFNPADSTGRKSVSIRWFMPDTTDYTRF
ncbi:MAG: hypothetical protein HPY81_08355 [Firmicutes bacterium]|nr:hypothetical protein [Bacillota bacterium]